jgi:hypothetical protein
MCEVTPGVECDHPKALLIVDRRDEIARTVAVYSCYGACCVNAHLQWVIENGSTGRALITPLPPV